jgi:hypothetical protein
MNVAFTLTADPVPVEQAFQRAGIASDNANKKIVENITKETSAVTTLATRIDRLKTARDQSNDPARIQRINALIAEQQTRYNSLTGSINKQGQAIQNVTAKTSNFTSQLKLAGAGIAAGFTIGAVINFTKEVAKATAELQSFQSRMEGLTGSSDLGNRKLDELRATADRLGLNFSDMTQNYIQFVSAAKSQGRSIEEAELIFNNMSIAIAGSGASSEVANRAMNALQQMMGKGCLGYNTPILMFDGSIELVQNIKKGDLLMGDDGTPRTVLSTVIGFEDMYLVTGKMPFTCNSGHILLLKDNNKIVKIEAKNYKGGLLGFDKDGNEYLAEIKPIGLNFYYGFEISGNRLFCLGDGTITHNTIMAEELKGQLGEAMPQAIGWMGQALGKTTAELMDMMQNGELTADTLLGFSKVAADAMGSNVQNMAEQLNAKTNRLANSWQRFLQQVGDSGLAEASIGALTAGVEALSFAWSLATFNLKSYIAEQEKEDRIASMDEASKRIVKQIQNEIQSYGDNELAIEALTAKLATQREELDKIDKALKRNEKSAIYGGNIPMPSQSELDNMKVVATLLEQELMYLRKSSIESAVITGETVKQRKEREAMLKAQEKMDEALRKAQKDLFAYLNSPEAQQNRTATVTVPEFAKDLGTGTEDRAVQAAKELQETADAQLTIFNALISDLDHSRAMDEMSEEEYLAKKLELQQEYAQDVNKTTEEIYNFKKRKSQEELELEREKLMMAADTALTLTGVYSNALEKQQIDLAKSREAGAITEEQYQQQVAQIKRKEFEVNRIAALAQIALNTAIALSQPTNVGTLGSLTPFIIGFNLAQAAVVATRPNPYAEGTKRVKGGQLGKDSVPYKEYNGQDALLMPGEMIVPTKRVNQHAPYLDNMFDGKISGTQSKWASDLFVSGRLDPGLLHFIASHTGMPIQSRSNDRSIVNAINRKAVPSFTRDANRIVDAINRTAPNNHRRWTR